MIAKHEGKRVFADMRYSNAKRQCENELARILTTMEGHKALDLPSGHEYYKILLKQAQAECVKLQDKASYLGLDAPPNVASNVPMLKQLEDLANGSTAEGTIAGKVISVAFGLAVLGLGLTVLLAVYHDVFVYLTHWVH